MINGGGFGLPEEGVELEFFGTSNFPNSELHLTRVIIRKFLLDSYGCFGAFYHKRC